MARAFALPAVFAALGCSRSAPGDFWLVLDAAYGSGVEVAHADVSPRDALLEHRAERGGVALRLRNDRGPVRVSAPGACPLVVPVPAAKGAVVERSVEPLFDLGPRERLVGPAKRFEIRAEPRCAEARKSRIELRVGIGAPLDDVRIEEGGRKLSATTRGAEAVREGITWGIVPVSAAERGATEIIARIRPPDGFSLERRLEVSALTRASGLPSVALGHGVLLAGKGLSLEKKPAGSRAELRVLGELSELVPDVRGHFALSDALGREIVVQAGRYDEMPLDCGRSDCHSAAAASVRHSPMTRALAAGLGGEHPLDAPECALACHATGEPGTIDGGFTTVQEELGLSELPAQWNELPRALRRLGGVGCLACHGPSAVPPESARWTVLRSDVCAVCHDSPPRYGHVAAFETTKMAKADRDERTRNAECARCHTAWGALGEPARRPPADVGAMGIGCVACHDVHPTAASDRTASLLRMVDVEAVLPRAAASARGPSRVCLACHSPGSEPLPAASAAAVWAGRGGLDPKSGDALEWPAPHAREPAGCLRCHGGARRPPPMRRYTPRGGFERGETHAFAASANNCVPCHEEAPKRRPELAARARAVLDALVPLAPGHTRSQPIHAEPLRVRLDDETMRALHNVLLVLEDGAADVHNPAYADMLVGSAEKVLGVGKSPERRPEDAPP